MVPQFITEPFWTNSRLMEHIKLILLVLLSCCLTQGMAQKSQFKKADKAYKAKNYAEAIPLYEEGLALQDNISKKTKLANCYRMTNQTDKAEALFREIVKDPKAKSKTYLYFGQTLMGGGKYDEAKYWFQQYHRLEPDDSARTMQLIAACNQVKDIRSYYPDMGVIPFPHNSDADDNAPFFHNGEMIFSSDRKQGVKLLKQKSGWTGREFIQVYSSVENDIDDYTEPKRYSGKVNELNKNSSNVSISADGKKAIFSRNSKNPNKKNIHTIQLFQMESTDGKRWKNPKVVAFCNDYSNYMHPAISPDGTKLYFTSNKPGGNGGTDIWVSEWKREKWGKPVNLGNRVNTSENEGFPFVDKDGKLFFCSKGHSGLGGFDIYFSLQDAESGSWEIPINIGTPVNSPSDDISLYLDPESRRGAFTSSRNGGDDDIYLFWLDGVPEKVEEEAVFTNTEIQAEPFTPETATEPGTTEAPTADDITTAEVATPAVAAPTVADNTTAVELPTTDSTVKMDELKRVEASAPATIQPSKIAETTTIATPIMSNPTTAPAAHLPQVLSTPEDIPTELPTDPAVNEPVNIPTLQEQEIPEANTVDSVMVPSVEKEMDTAANNVEQLRRVNVSRKIIPADPNSIVSETSVETASTNMPNSTVANKKRTNPVTIGQIAAAADQAAYVEAPTPTASDIPTIETDDSESFSTTGFEEPSVADTPEANPSREAVDVATTDLPATATTAFDAKKVYTGAAKKSSLSDLKKDSKRNRLKTGKTYQLPNFAYPANSYMITRDQAKTLDYIAGFLSKNKRQLIIASHSHAVGDDDNNLRLTQSRANAVKKYLIRKGVDEKRLMAVGYGEQYLVNDCENGVACKQKQHAENERVEIIVME